MARAHGRGRAHGRRPTDGDEGRSVHAADGERRAAGSSDDKKDVNALAVAVANARALQRRAIIGDGKGWMDGCCLMRSFELGRYREITGSRYRNLWMCPKFVGQGWVKMRCRRPSTEEARGWFFFFVCKIWNLTNAREIVARGERLTFEFLNPKRCRLTDRTGKEATAPRGLPCLSSHRNVLCTSSKIIGKVLQSDSFHLQGGLKGNGSTTRV